MCVESVPPPPSRVTRRGVLAGAAALAGTAALTAAPGAAAAPARGATDAPAPGAPRTGDLVVEGGTLLDPATGEVTEDAVVVIRDGVVRAAGARARIAVPAGAPASTPTAGGCCPA